MINSILIVDEVQKIIMVFCSIITIYFIVFTYIRLKKSNGTQQISPIMYNYLVISFCNVSLSLPYMLYLALAWKPCKSKFNKYKMF